MSDEPVGGIGVGGRTEPETSESGMQRIHSQMLILMETVLEGIDRLSLMRGELERLWTELEAGVGEGIEIEKQLQAHLQAKPLEPEKSDYSDEAEYKAELTRYQASLSAWSVTKNRLESQLKDLNLAIFRLREQIERQLEILNDSTAQVKELGEKAEKLAAQAKTLLTRDTLAEYQEINVIKEDLLEKLAAFLKTVEQIWAEIRAHSQTEPQVPGSTTVPAAGLPGAGLPGDD